MNEQPKFQLPGAFWVALVTAIIGLLQGDWFAGQMWVPGAVIALGAIAKIVEVYQAEQQAKRSIYGWVRPPVWQRVLLG
jgi:hypothetical protein